MAGAYASRRLGGPMDEHRQGSASANGFHKVSSRRPVNSGTVARSDPPSAEALFLRALTSKFQALTPLTYASCKPNAAWCEAKGHTAS